MERLIISPCRHIPYCYDTANMCLVTYVLAAKHRVPIVCLDGSVGDIRLEKDIAPISVTSLPDVWIIQINQIFPTNWQESWIFILSNWFLKLMWLMRLHILWGLYQGWVIGYYNWHVDRIPHVVYSPHNVEADTGLDWTLFAALIGLHPQCKGLNMKFIFVLDTRRIPWEKKRHASSKQNK